MVPHTPLSAAEIGQKCLRTFLRYFWWLSYATQRSSWLFVRGFIMSVDGTDVPASTLVEIILTPPLVQQATLSKQIASNFTQQSGPARRGYGRSEQGKYGVMGFSFVLQKAQLDRTAALLWKNARITAAGGEDFSLKNSPKFDFHPVVWKTPDTFSAKVLLLSKLLKRKHRLPPGLGWRHFTPTWMSGTNFFFT